MKRAWIGIGTLAALSLLVAPLLTPFSVQFVYNPSDSVARGWYRIGGISGADLVHVGSTVLVRLPPRISTLAVQRGYLPSNVPLLKHVGAVAPQRVCIRDRVVYVDGAVAATALSHDAQQRILPVSAQCGALAHGTLFLLSTHSPASFDSRYLGPVAVADVIGVAIPIWTWEGS